MSKSLSDHLQELKPILPKGYQGMIEKALVDIELWRIKKAFAGQSQPQDVLRKIFRAATRLSKQYLREQERDRKLVEELQELAESTE